MSKPILYESTEVNFNHLGLGVLNETLSATVTEERNGSFYLEVVYPSSGKLFKELKNDRILKADAGHELKDQRFVIKKITKNLDGKMSIYAEHVSYITKDLVLQPEVTFSGSANDALRMWKGQIIGSNPLVVDSDVTTTSKTSLSIKDVKNAREALGGVEGSILDRWGGEYKFDNFHISLKKQRGRAANGLIAYGRNLIQFEQEESINSTYTSIYPYMTYSSEDQKEYLVTADDRVVHSKYVEHYSNPKILVVDFSSEFEHTDTISEKKIKAKLHTLAENYIKANKIGIPKVAIQLSHIDLSKTSDYFETVALEELNLCDKVTIRYEKLGIKTDAKVVRIVWNVLKDQYDELEIGDVRPSLSNLLHETSSKIEKAQYEANMALTSANGKNAIFYGSWLNPPGPPAKLVGDGWFEPDGDFQNQYLWDGRQWKKILATRDLEVVKKEVDKALDEIDLAKKQAEEAFEKASTIEGDVKKYASETDDKLTEITSGVNGLKTMVNNKADSSQLIQLATDINLRVKKDDLISQINLSAGRTLIQSNKILLDAESVTFSGKAFIPSAFIKDLKVDAATIYGTLNAANVNLINVNAKSIVAGTITSIDYESYGKNGSGTSIKDGELRLYSRNKNYGTIGFTNTTDMYVRSGKASRLFLAAGELSDAINTQLSMASNSKLDKTVATRLEANNASIQLTSTLNYRKSELSLLNEEIQLLQYNPNSPQYQTGFIIKKNDILMYIDGKIRSLKTLR